MISYWALIAKPAQVPQMQKLVALLFIAILAGSVTIPNVFSDSENEQNTQSDNNQNDNHVNQNATNSNEGNSHENQNETQGSDDHGNNKDNETKIHFGFSNATSVNITLPNGTIVTFGFSNGTNIGQQISSFIHQIRNGFKQQETMEKQAIKDCREQARENPSDRKNIMNQCRATLQGINQQFRGEQKQLHVDFKQLRSLVPDNIKQGHENFAQKDAKIHNNTLEKLHGLGHDLNHGKQNQNHGKQNSNHGKQNHGRHDWI